MVSPVAQMILDLVENNQLDMSDIQAINLATTNKLIARNQEEERATIERLAQNATAAPPVWQSIQKTIFGSSDAKGDLVEYNGRYRINKTVSPKYLHGIRGIARRKSRNARRANMIEFEVEQPLQERCKRFLDPSGKYMDIPGITLEKDT